MYAGNISISDSWGKSVGPSLVVMELGRGSLEPIGHLIRDHHHRVVPSKYWRCNFGQTENGKYNFEQYLKDKLLSSDAMRSKKAARIELRSTHSAELKPRKGCKIFQIRIASRAKS